MTAKQVKISESLGEVEGMLSELEYFIVGGKKGALLLEETTLDLHSNAGDARLRGAMCADGEGIVGFADSVGVQLQTALNLLRKVLADTKGV